MPTIQEILAPTDLTYTSPVRSLLPALGIDRMAAERALQRIGISLDLPIQEVMRRLGLTNTSSIQDAIGAAQGQPAAAPPPSSTSPAGTTTGARTATPTPSPTTQPGQGGSTLRQRAAEFGIGPELQQRIIANPEFQRFFTSQPWIDPQLKAAVQSNPAALLDMTFTDEQLGVFFRDPGVSQLLRNPQTQTAIGVGPQDVEGFLGRIGGAAPAPGSARSGTGPTGPTPPISTTFPPGITGMLQGGGQGPDVPPAGLFPQDPAIQLPPWAQPQPFQAPPAPNLPTSFQLPPELVALQNNLQSMLQGQQETRSGLLQAIQQQIQQQEGNLATNQPLLDAALANIQSVLTGQAASPGLEGLVQSAFDPVEAEATRRLRQTAEEAAAMRGMSLTDTPIGQPFLQETRHLQENLGGQRAQALMGLRQQDAQFSENVRQFQEGLRQQAMTNRLGVIQSMGTPEQAAQVLSNLGLGARQSALQQFATQGQLALGASDQALRSALGASQVNQGNMQLGLASQAQGFQQQFARQQASIQNQLAAMAALGDPNSAFSSFSQSGSGLADQQLLNRLRVAQLLQGGNINFPTGSTTTSVGSQPSNFGQTLSGLGTFGIGLGMLGRL